jgi:hypothetical protein
MKKPIKIIAVILLVAGIGLSGAGVYLSYFIGAHTECETYLSEAKRKESAVQAAAGTPGEKALKEDASIAQAGAESVCLYSRQCKQNGMLIGIGGLISIIISVVLLTASRKASKQRIE